MGLMDDGDGEPQCGYGGVETRKAMKSLINNTDEVEIIRDLPRQSAVE